MGITIHYGGKIDSIIKINEFCTELADIADDMEWKYQIIGLDEPDKFKGIVINPHRKAESLSFLFNETGYLNSLAALHLKDYDKPKGSSASIKTQFAPIDIHVAVIKLLKYIKKKYIHNLRVNDEGSYWDTGDKELLSKKLAFLNSMMDHVAEVLSGIKRIENESREDAINRIEKILIQKLQVTATRVKNKL